MIEQFLSQGVLVAMRVGGLMTFAPFFANAALPAPVKAGLTLVLTALLVPVYASTSAAAAASVVAPSGITGWLMMALSEIALGMVIGFATQFVFEGMELAGQIASFQFGFSLVNVIDPNSQVEVTVLSTLHDLIAVLIFLQLGVHRWLLRATAMSFRVIPPGSLATAHFPAAGLIKMSGAMWLIGAEIAFPIVLATMLTDLTIGFVAKASPQFPALFFGISLKFLLGIAVLYGSVAFWPHLLERYFYHALTNLESLLAFHS
ncbi:MAG: flagellar biosynthetic protein FliR [Candidatus Acidiferrales bacterium]